MNPTLGDSSVKRRHTNTLSQESKTSRDKYYGPKISSGSVIKVAKSRSSSPQRIPMTYVGEQTISNHASSKDRFDE